MRSRSRSRSRRSRHILLGTGAAGNFARSRSWSRCCEKNGRFRLQKRYSIVDGKCQDIYCIWFRPLDGLSTRPPLSTSNAHAQCTAQRHGWPNPGPNPLFSAEAILPGTRLSISLSHTRCRSRHQRSFPGASARREIPTIPLGHGSGP